MKIAIIFYSFSGNTKRACAYLQEILCQQGRDTAVDLVQLAPKKELTAFIAQCRQAFFRQKPPLQEVNLDIAGYDVIICASPVWAFTYAPALRTYLETVKDLTGKRGACFVTYHSGAGAQRTLRELEAALRKKGAEVFFSNKLSGEKTSDIDYLKEKFSHLIEKLTVPVAQMDRAQASGA